MQVKLTWVNRNLKAAQVDIYRSTTSQATPPDSDLIATGIDAAKAVYYDNTALYGQTYYYVFKTYNGKDTPIYSSPKQLKVLIDTGPGPQDLVLGDYNLGYFGKTLYNDLISTADLATALGVTISSQVQPVYWDKFIRKGKVLFIPRNALGTINNTWTLYNAGGVYGTDDTGPSVIASASRVMQNKRVTKNGYTFKVRLPRGIADEYGEVLPVAYADANTIKPYRFNSEVAQIHYPRFRSLPVEASFLQVADIATGSYVSNSIFTGSTLNQAGTQFIGCSNGTSGTNTAATARASLSAGTITAVAGGAQVSAYVPVLELDHQLLTVEV